MTPELEHCLALQIIHTEIFGRTTLYWYFYHEMITKLFFGRFDTEEAQTKIREHDQLMNVLGATLARAVIDTYEKLKGDN